jgi:hypothetical protein
MSDRVLRRFLYEVSTTGPGVAHAAEGAGRSEAQRAWDLNTVGSLSRTEGTEGFVTA